MSSNRRRIDSELLHDYVDDQLDAETRLEVARHIGENPLDAALVQAYRDQNEALQRLYGRTAEEPVPQHLLDLVEGARLEHEHVVAAPSQGRSARRGGWEAWAVGLVVVLTLCLGGAAGWWGRGIQEAGLTRQRVLNAFLDQAVQSYSLYADSTRQPVDTSTGSVQEFTDWFKQQLNIRIHVPQPGADFKLVSARILPMAFGSAGQLVYADPAGRRFAVYIQVPTAVAGNLSALAASQTGSDAVFVRHGGFSIYYWASGNVTYALVSPLDQSALGTVMKEILNPDNGDSAPPPSSGSSKTRA